MWLVALVVVAGAGFCISRGANSPADPVLVDPVTGLTPDSGGRRPLEGFSEIGFVIRNGSLATEQLCALLADDSQSRAQGLMNQTDMRGYDAMLFRFDTDTDASFFMKDTPMPLSIAWFDADSRFVASTDMEPCLGQSSCPLYRPPRPYRIALEVPRGRLEDLGIGPGAVIDGGGLCR